MGRAANRQLPERAQQSLVVTNSMLADVIESRIQAWLDSLDDPLRRAAACGWLLAELDVLADEVATTRAAAVRQLSAEGWSFTEIGGALGISRSRAHQLADR